MATVARFFDESAGSYFLFGPRGTGKSTWLRTRYPDAAWIDLLDAETERNYYTRPERLTEFLKAHAGRDTVVIDEIQRVPELLPVIHRHIELDKSKRFVLTGSSARKLRREGVDLLAGRALLCSMHPFMAAELGDRFDLEATLRLGLVPLVVMADAPDRTLRGYIDLYLQQEVKAEGLVRRLDDFSRFLEVASFSHAQLLNVAEIARECMASRNTVESYLGILEDLLIATRIPVFRRRAKRAVVAHTKFYFFDCGVFGSLRPAGLLDAREESEGAALEGLVLQHLRAWIGYGHAGYHIFFWRTRGGSEVDFVLYGAEGFHAIEVKKRPLAASRRPQRHQDVSPRLSGGDAAAPLPRQRDPGAGRHPLRPGRSLPARAGARPRSATLTAGEVGSGHISDAIQDSPSHRPAGVTGETHSGPCTATREPDHNGSARHC